MFSRNLKYLRQVHGIEQADLALKLGRKSASTISEWESGKYTPKIGVLSQIANIFNVDIDDLMTKDLSSPTEVCEPRTPYGRYRIPVIATVAAGVPTYSDEQVIEWIDYHKDPKDHVFAVHVKGDSMMPRIHDGDIIIVDQDAEWDDGDIVVVTINGDEGTCKRIKKYNDSIALISLNPQYDPMIYTVQQVQELPIRVVGKVTQVRGDI